MRIEEKKKVTSTQTVVTGYKCDQCGKIHLGGMPNNWHEFCSGHESWGKDSGDSYKDHIVCSPACFVEKLRSLNSELDGRKFPEISEMPLEFSKDLVEFVTTLAKMDK